MKINEYLLQFLSTGNKEAAIPGLGVFYTDLRNTISFREVAPTDRAFIKYVAQKSGVDEIAVSSSIDVWVKSILQDLKTMGRAIIQDIGSFEVTGNKVVFAPETQMPEIPVAAVPNVVLDVEDDDLPVEKPADTFGMEEDEDPYAPALKDEESTGSSFASKNLWWIILISVVVLAVIAVFLVPATRGKIMSFITSGGSGQVTEVVLGGDIDAAANIDMDESMEAEDGEEYIVDVAGAPAASPQANAETKPAITPSTPVEQASKPTTTSASKPGSTKTTTAKPAAKPASTKTAAQQPAKIGGKYNIIAGTFKERPNADKEVQRFRKLGYSNARVVLNNGFYYVSLNSFATRDEAVNYKLKLGDKNVQGWVKELN